MTIDPMTTLLVYAGYTQWFNHAQLLTAKIAPPEVIDSFLASDQVQFGEYGQMYRLTPTAYTQSMALIRQTWIFDELDLYEQCLEFATEHYHTLTAEIQRQFEQARCRIYFAEWCECALAQRNLTALSAFLARWSEQEIIQADPVTQALSMVYAWQIDLRSHKTIPITELQAHVERLLNQADLADAVRFPALNLLGSIHWFQSNLEQAHDTFALLAQSAGDHGYFVGLGLLNQSLTKSVLDDYTQAADLARQALDHFQKIHHRYREAHCLYEIGASLLYLGEWDAASRYLEQSASIYAQSKVVGDLPHIYWFQGFLHHLLGKDEQSYAYYQRSIALAQAEDSINEQAQRDSLAFLGLLYASQHNWNEALATYAQAEALALQHNDMYELALIQFRRGDALRRSGDAQAAFQAYASAINNVEQLRISMTSEEMKLGVLGTTQQMYEYMVLLCIEQNDYVNAVNYIERARARALLDSFQNAQSLETLDQQCVTVAEIQAALAPKTGIIEYFTVGVLARTHSFLHVLAQNNPTLYNHFRHQPATYIAIITNRDLTIQPSPLDPTLLNRGTSTNRLLQPRILRTLYAGLITPCLDVLQHAELVYLIPHGVLHDVPFMALQDHAERWLIQANHAAIAIVPSATVLIRYAMNQTVDHGDQCLAFGFNGSGENALELAEFEAQHIARLTHGSAWVGASALPNLLEQAHNARIVHIASHGEYRTDEPLNSFLALNANTNLTAQMIMQRLKLHAELVVLSACVSGRSFIAIGDNPYGLQRAFLYAGTRNVLCSLWEIPDVVALTLMDCFYQALLNGASTAQALKQAMIQVRTMTVAEFMTLAQTIQMPISGFEQLNDPQHTVFDDPSYWAGFMLIGVG